MSILDELLGKRGLKYEDLKSDAERETLNRMLDSLKTGQLDVGKVRVYIQDMKNAVEHKLARSDLNSKEDLFLKARLQNYLLLEAFLSTPEKAKKQIETAIDNMAEGMVR